MPIRYDKQVQLYQVTLNDLIPPQFAVEGQKGQGKLRYGALFDIQLGSMPSHGSQFIREYICVLCQ